MNPARNLPELLAESARRFPDRTAVLEPGGRSLTSRQLDALSDRFHDRLHHLGVRHSDRVGLRLHKSVDAVACIFGILKAGAAYVPVDVESPAARGAFILYDCEVKALVTETRLEEALAQELRQLGASPRVLSLDDAEDESALGALLERLQADDPAPRVASRQPLATDLAYVLYTSGSTGRPKGVALTHANALSFIDWCSERFEPSGDPSPLAIPLGQSADRSRVALRSDEEFVVRYLTRPRGLLFGSILA